MKNTKLGDARALKLERQRRYREKHRDELRRKGREYDAKFRKTEHRKKYLLDNKEKFSEYKRKWYLENRKEVLEKRRKYAENNYDNRKKYLKEYRERPEYLELKREQGRRYREKNKYKIRVRNVAYAALKKGELVKRNKCEKCGKRPTEMHHADYSQPLNIQWLCKRCHMIADGLSPIQ